MKGFLWKPKEVRKDFFNIAIPMLGSSLAWGVGFSLHSLIMGHLGSDATAASSITSVAQELITCVCKGISAGSGIMIGKLLGQNLFDKAKEYGRKFCHISFWTGGIHMLLLCALGPVVARFFVLSPAEKSYTRVIKLWFFYNSFPYLTNHFM